MIVRILAEFTVAPENTKIAKKLFKKLAKETSKEEGCFLYDLNQVSGQENTFIIKEIFGDKESQDFHKTTKHYIEILKSKIEPLLIDKKVRFLI